MDQFKHLFTPFKIGPVTVPNRIVFGAHEHRLQMPIGPPNERVVHYYEARAKGGAGLIITSYHIPTPYTTVNMPIAVQDDKAIPAFASVAKAIHEKEVVALPVIFGGRVNDPILAQQILEDNHADLISMARPLIADPELPNKAREERIDEIRKCIACKGVLFESAPLTCAINPEAGREVEFAIKPAAHKKEGNGHRWRSSRLGDGQGGCLKRP